MKNNDAVTGSIYLQPIGELRFFLNGASDLIENFILERYEENDKLGRFVDIDVYYDSINSINRNKLRKCYLCEKPAFVCGRNKSHSQEEILDYIKQNVLDNLVNIINNLCDHSIMEELNLHPKFGLVTPYTNGSHKDMDFNLMIKAKEAIIPYFKKMFLEGYKNLKHSKMSEEFISQEAYFRLQRSKPGSRKAIYKDLQRK